MKKNVRTRQNYSLELENILADAPASYNVRSLQQSDNLQTPYLLACEATPCVGHSGSPGVRESGGSNLVFFGGVRRVGGVALAGSPSEWVPLAEVRPRRLSSAFEFPSNFEPMRSAKRSSN